MKIKWSIILLTFLGVMAAMCAAVLTATLRVKPIKAVAAMTPPMVEVLVAAHAIPAMTIVDAGMLSHKTVRRDKLPGNHMSDPVQAIGKVVADSVRMLVPESFSRRVVRRATEHDLIQRQRSTEKGVESLPFARERVSESVTPVTTATGTAGFGKPVLCL